MRTFVWGEISSRNQQPAPPLSDPLEFMELEFIADELLLRPPFISLDVVPGGWVVWLVPVVPPFIERFELVPVPREAEPEVPLHPGRLVEADPDEFSEPDELLFRVEDPGEPEGEVVDPLMPDELLDDPLAAAPPEAPPLWAKAAATLSDKAMPVMGYNNVLLSFMEAHSVCRFAPP